MVALVLRRGLNGKYKSSRVESNSAAFIFCSNASVNLPWLEIDFKILSLRCSNCLKRSISFFIVIT